MSNEGGVTGIHYYITQSAGNNRAAKLEPFTEQSYTITSPIILITITCFSLTGLSRAISSGHGHV